jgi:hypothetical protein
VRLPNPGLADQQHVLPALDEGACRQVNHLRFWHLLVELKVEVLKRLQALEAGSPNALVELPRISTIDLVGQQAHQEFFVGELLVNGLAHAHL